ncbi:MAG: hypothetical protein OSJ70_06985 [Bacilli bacterium]|nr:hypothetical protein [Bacilli bacterium]
MELEKEYLEHKKKTIIDLVNRYNRSYVKEYQFGIDEENLDIHQTFCSGCKGCGKCCDRFPCVYSPRDFLDITNLDYMRRILDTGVVTIVRYNNKYPLIIRNRGVLDEDRIAGDDIDAYNTCLLLRDNGCMIPDSYRASQGLLYVVGDYGHAALYGDEDYLLEYDNYIYQEALSKLYEEYKNVVIPKKSEILYDDDRGISIPKYPMSEERVSEFIKSLTNKK